MWKWIKRALLAGGAAGTALLAMLAYVVFFGFNSVDSEMLRKLTDDVGQVRAFADVRPGSWDLVCPLSSYETLAHLRYFEPRIDEGMRSSPSSFALRDGEWALAFVNLKQNHMELVVVGGHAAGQPIIASIGGPDIRGPRCLERARAYFQVKRYKYPDHAYGLTMIIQGGAPASPVAPSA